MQMQIQNELDFLLALAMKKCDTPSDAEDLVQETVLAALVYLEKGSRIENMRAFLLGVLNRKYYDMLRRKYRFPVVTVGELPEMVGDDDMVTELICREEAETLRREVAHLMQSYRMVMVEHYFHNKSLKQISEEWNLPIGTVKSRLDFGRKQVRKGFEEMEMYQENSYMPKHLIVRNSGRLGMYEEPMSLTEGDVLAQNLLILAYEKPLTIAELSKAIGVAAAYIEPVIQKLVRGELMKRLGDGRVYTDFILYEAEDFVKYKHEAEDFVQKHITAYTEPVKIAIEELKKTDFYSERLERFLLLQVAEAGCMEGMEAIREHPQVFPERPNGGRWIAFGTIYPECYTIPAEKRGKEEYGFSGRRCTSIDRYLDAEGLALYNYETSLDANSGRKHGGYEFTSFQEIEFNQLKFFYLLEKGLHPETVDLDVRILKGISHMEECGFLSVQNGMPKVLVPVLSKHQAQEFFEICRKAQNAFSEQIKPYFAEYCRTHKKQIPAHLKGIPDQKLTMPYEPSAMMFVYEAIEQGLHPRELGYACPETIVVFD